MNGIKKINVKRICISLIAITSIRLERFSLIFWPLAVRISRTTDI